MSATHLATVNTISSQKATLIWLATSLVALLIVGLTLLAPLSAAHQNNFLAPALYRAFGFVCHQIPARSFYLSGHPFAICARCFGLYTGFALGTILYPLLVRPINQTLPPARFWLIAALIPTALDFGLDFCGVHANTHFSRLLTGLLLGAVSAFYVIPGLVDLQNGWKKFFSSPDNDKLDAHGTGKGLS
jgi:uncharacterized membrane protein